MFTDFGDALFILTFQHYFYLFIYYFILSLLSFFFNLIMSCLSYFMCFNYLWSYLTRIFNIAFNQLFYVFKHLDSVSFLTSFQIRFLIHFLKIFYFSTHWWFATKISCFIFFLFYWYLLFFISTFRFFVWAIHLI